jgi:hypothetical protein
MVESSSKLSSRKNAATTRGAAARTSTRRKGKRPFRIPVCLLFSFLALLAVGYFALVIKVLDHHAAAVVGASEDATPLLILPQQKAPIQNTTATTSPQSKADGSFKLASLPISAKRRARYSDWRDLAVQLAALPADQILTTLKTTDPFGVRQFEENLKQTESDRQAILQREDLQRLFPCPVDDERITLPDQRNHQRSKLYRKGLSELKQTKEEFVFLFFQHLRKAGGTNFCGLAKHNLLKPQVPP